MKLECTKERNTSFLLTANAVSAFQMSKSSSGLRSWSSGKKTSSIEEDAVEAVTNRQGVDGNEDSGLRSWSKNSKQSAKVSPETTTTEVEKIEVVSMKEDTDSAEHHADISKLKKRVSNATTKVKKGKEAWARVRQYRESGSISIFKKAKKIATKKKKLGKVFDLDRTHTITANIDKIRIRQAHVMKTKQDSLKQQQKEELSRSKIPWYRRTINPRNPIKETWDIMCLILVMINAIEIPFLLAFPDQDGMNSTLTLIVDWIFIVDVVFCFRTGYELGNGELEMHDKAIVEKYLATWFPIDFCACFPLEIFFATDDAAGDNARLTTMLRLLKMPRLLRLGRLFKYIERFKYAGFMKIARFILGIILIAHWVGCTSPSHRDASCIF